MTYRRQDRWHWAAWLAAALASLAPGAARADEAAGPQIVVTAPGGDIDADDAIGLDAHDLRRTGSPDLLGSLDALVPGLSLAATQSNPWQPDLHYRGFTASPLQGNAQGLAVYVDGVRFNQPFGDTVDFDLLPDAAIEAVSIRDASPVYGLNALGGALLVTTRTGRGAPGLHLALSGGDHGRREATAEAGWASGAASAYLALEADHDDGWRVHSPSTLYRGFADLGWDGAGVGAHLKLSAADTDLTGNGPAPVELLAAAPSAVFTYPDITRNRAVRLSLHPWAQLGAHDRVTANLSFQALDQHTVNGDTADIATCGADPAALCLADAQGLQAPLFDTSGAAIADQGIARPYALLNRSRTLSHAWGALVQLTDRRALAAGENELVLGFSLDAATTRFASSNELGQLGADRGVTGLGPVIDQPDGGLAPVGLDVTTRYLGLFLAESLPLTPRLDAELGLRWNLAHIRLDDRIGTALDGTHRFARLNPGIEFDYRLTGAVSLRAGYSEANRSPTPAELSCADAAAPCSLTNFFIADPPLRQVVTRSWELGASGAIAGAWHGSWRVSAWRSTNSDDILYTASATRGLAWFRNLGSTRRQGIEADASLSRGPWTLRLGYAFTDATFRTAFVLDSPDNPSADASGRIQVLPGDRMPSIPRHRVTASVGYATGRFELGLDARAQSGSHLIGDEANVRPQTAGFAVFDLHAAFRLDAHVRLTGSVENLAGHRHVTSGTFWDTSGLALSEVAHASDPRSLSPAPPRRFRVGIEVTR
ncbi:MAG: TonB-dependent receptor [Sphingomonadales bacterium]|nr:TonB-dependent receptor [Sphingomonadales bacterium]MDE2570676.1 TonB-dependent receptor [Sphingomonadales bacterium]